MQFVYKPEGAEPKKWEFDPDRLLSPEAIAIEKLTRMRYAEWTDAVHSGSMEALHALLWVMLKRETPTLKPSDVVFAIADVDFELDDEETADLIGRLEEKAAVEGLSVGDEALLDSLRAQQPESAGESGEDEDPKED